jgi:hypothetical protein
MPVTMNLLAGMSVNSLKWNEPDKEDYFRNRITYLYQLLIARKMTSNLSLQIMPSFGAQKSVSQPR